MVGRLGWASQYICRRMGRAMPRPLYAQQYCPLAGGAVGPLLELALQWWEQVLRHGIHQEQRFADMRADPAGVLNLFCDARGEPPRVAAVLFGAGAGPLRDRQAWFTDWEPLAALLAIFDDRSDNQIMAQELLAIVVGLCTFIGNLAGRTVRVWTDNAGGEGALRTGAAKSCDHNLLVHAVWLLAAKHRYLLSFFAHGCV